MKTKKRAEHGSSDELILPEHKGTHTITLYWWEVRSPHG